MVTSNVHTIIFTGRKNSCGKVMFSQVCVKNSVRGEEVSVPLHAGIHTPPALGRNFPPPRDGHCSGWYASYWNAFLLLAATKLGQGYIFTSVCLSTGGRGVCLSACWDTHPPTPQEQTNLKQTHPHSDTPRHPPGADPLEQTPPQEQTPPPGKQTAAYG